MPTSRTLLMLGFGCVGQAVLPLLQRHAGAEFSQRVIVSADDEGRAQAEAEGCRFVHERLTPATFSDALARELGPGDVLLNLSVGVCSVSLLEWCREHDVDYLDTCTEPWTGLHLDAARPAEVRTTYALREAALALRVFPWRSTALLTHGANPGLSFHFLKQGLLELAALVDVAHAPPRDLMGWAALAQRLDVRLIHVAEHDSQHEDEAADENEFANTWSAEGFAAESWQPAEIGWGTHEAGLPRGAREHERGCRSAVYLDRPGAVTRVSSRTPMAGEYEGFLVSLADAVAFSDALSVHEGGHLQYRPTACYVYRPCDAAAASLHGLARRGGRLQPRRRLLQASLIGGCDELGVLLVSPRFGSYWYGSRLTLDAARALAPHNSATSLQVAAGVLAGLLWMLEHPAAGVIEPSGLPHERILRAARPYLGDVRGVRLESAAEAAARIERFRLQTSTAATAAYRPGSAE